MNGGKTSLKSLLAKTAPFIQRTRRFSFVLFISFVALLYGFIVFRINSLNGTEPTPDSVTSQVKAANVPHIDKAVVEQLESLNNNSVNVQALFNEARSNPFL